MKQQDGNSRINFSMATNASTTMLQIFRMVSTKMTDDSFEEDEDTQEKPGNADNEEDEEGL